MSFFDRPTPLSRKNAYFAAANTHKGFRSYFGELFAPYRKLVIKAGPGCGKSTLMKKFAQAAEKKGHTVLRYYCSSDTSSLDAVAIPSLSLVILDGTPPHTVEPYLPVACDSLVDLTAFLDSAALSRYRDTASAEQETVSRLYGRAYHLMAAVYSLELACDNVLADAFCEDSAKRIVCRLLDKYGIEGEGEGKKLIRPTSALGVKGYVAFDTHERGAALVLSVKDRGIFAHRFFALLEKELFRRGKTFEVTPRPLDERIDSLYLPEERILFTSRQRESEADGRINLDRMLPCRGTGILKECRPILKEADTLLSILTATLERIGSHHDRLESCYISAMDFDSLNTFSEELIKKEIVDS